MSSEREAYDDLCFYTLGHGGPAFIHQLVVDAFTAQQADETTRPIALTFALVGLYLHVERHLSGRDVQRVHMTLAKRKRSWPRFSLPTSRGEMSSVTVMSAPEGTERDEAIEAWCATVWSAYRHHQPELAALLREYGIE